MTIDELIEQLVRKIESLETPADKVCALNDVRAKLHAVSPFADEPVDYVRWIDADLVIANDYNPNTVAPPEMKLLGSGRF